MDVARPAGRQQCKLKLFRRGGACKQNPCTAQCTLAGPGPLRARAALASTVAKDLSTSMQNRRWCTHAFHHIHSHKGNCDTYYFGKRPPFSLIQRCSNSFFEILTNSFEVNSRKSAQEVSCSTLDTDSGASLSHRCRDNYSNCDSRESFFENVFVEPVWPTKLFKMKV